MMKSHQLRKKFFLFGCCAALLTACGEKEKDLKYYYKKPEEAIIVAKKCVTELASFDTPLTRLRELRDDEHCEKSYSALVARQGLDEVKSLLEKDITEIKKYNGRILPTDDLFGDNFWLTLATTWLGARTQLENEQKFLKEIIEKPFAQAITALEKTTSLCISGYLGSNHIDLDYIGKSWADAAHNKSCQGFKEARYQIVSKRFSHLYQMSQTEKIAADQDLLAALKTCSITDIYQEIYDDPRVTDLCYKIHETLEEIKEEVQKEKLITAVENTLNLIDEKCDASDASINDDKSYLIHLKEYLHKENHEIHYELFFKKIRKIKEKCIAADKPKN